MSVKLINQISSKKGAFGKGSNKKWRLDDNGGIHSSKSQRISTRGSKRLMILNTEEKRKSATILSWLIDSQIVPESATIYYTGVTIQTGFKKGIIERSGILCTCCQFIFTITEFQTHTGGRVCDNPYDAIGVDGIQGDGSITPLSVCMKFALQNPDAPEHHRIKYITSKGSGGDIYDDACILCADGGNLICCEQCNSTFHVKCLDMKVVPKGPYYCTYCACKLCGMAITKWDSCLRCSLCEKQYHIKCSRERVTIDINHFPRAFCETSCRKVHEMLESNIGVKNKLEDGLSWTLLHRFDKEYSSFEVDASKILECHCKLAVAFKVMTACFEPIKDRHTRINMIKNIVYNCGSHYRRINFCGFFTAILEKDDEIITVASLRVHGTNQAEIPFIATVESHRNKGMCGKLLNGIESNLQDLGVKTLVIPSSSEMIKVWNDKYGFNLLKEETKKEIMKLNTVMFHDCLRMQKMIPERIDLNVKPSCKYDRMTVRY